MIIPVHDQDRISPCNIKPTNDENKEKYQSGDYWLTQYQILQTYIIGIVWQTVRIIANKILGLKGLGWSKSVTLWMKLLKLNKIISRARGVVHWPLSITLHYTWQRHKIMAHTPCFWAVLHFKHFLKIESAE